MNGGVNAETVVSATIGYLNQVQVLFWVIEIIKYANAKLYTK